MQVEHHDLHHEFPEYKERIHFLKGSDAHFVKLFNSYDDLDHEVRRLENLGSPLPDADMEALKLRRVHLKDALFAYLSKPL